MSMFDDMGDIIEMCAQTVEVHRRGSSISIDGVFRKDLTVSVSEASGSLQPASKSDLKFVPDLYVSEAVFTFSTQCELFAPDEDNDIAADQICSNGDFFEVVSVKDWKAVGGFKKYFLVKVNR